MSPEEFAQCLKKRGYVYHIADARRYVASSGKTEFTEADFEEAYHKINIRPIGREYVREAYEDNYVYFRGDEHGNYWPSEVRDI